MSRDATFLKEQVVYQYLKDAGVSTPKHYLIDDDKGVMDLPFNSNDKIVIKGIADNLWHKSDEGALFFEVFDKNNIKKIIATTKEKLIKKYDDLSFLICEKIDFLKHQELPSEAFISFKKDDSLGLTLVIGLGGIHAELWAKDLKIGVNQWAINVISPDEAYEDFKKHLIGKVWLGDVRQGRPMTSEKVLKNFFKSLWTLGKKIEKEQVELLEINPLVLDKEGIPTALDGVGLKSQNLEEIRSVSYNSKNLLAPKKIGIAGVSDKPGSFGKKILENLLGSKVSRNNIKIIRPKSTEFMGIECFDDVSHLKDSPVDILILAVPAPITVKVLHDLIEQEGGAEFVYVVAGGIGDGADKNNYVGVIKNLLNNKRESGKWTPGIIGPNSLGIVLGPQKISTLFLSPDRLPISFYENGNIALVSQSGAFLITRLSSESKLPVKYGFAIGSQLDLKASDMLKLISEDVQINVFGFYFEGFEKSDALKFALLAKDLIRKGKQVILYKGGRSQSGMKAASGHTGAMAGDYDLINKVFTKAGITVSETMEEFSANLLLLSSYPSLKSSSSLVTLTNAGFEAVSCADHFGDTINIKAEKMLKQMVNLKSYNDILDNYKLAGLVSASNPLDLTPMANEEVFLKSVDLLVNEYDIIILSIVPFTERIDALNKEATTQFVSSLANIRDKSGKVIIVVVDAGDLYESYRQSFSLQGFPVFNTIERPMIVLKNLFS